MQNAIVETLSHVVASYLDSLHISHDEKVEYALDGSHRVTYASQKIDVEFFYGAAGELKSIYAYGIDGGPFGADVAGVRVRFVKNDGYRKLMHSKQGKTFRAMCWAVAVAAHVGSGN